MNPILSPHIVATGGGMAYDVFGMHVRVLVSAAETNSSHSVLEITVPPGGGTPPHTHTRETETFYLLKGTLRFSCGEQRIDATPGACIFAPKNISHSYENRTIRPARILVICTPAGLENFFRDAAARPPNDSPDQIEKLCGRYGMALP